MQVGEAGSLERAGSVEQQRFLSDRALSWRERETLVLLFGRQIPLLVPVKDDPRLIEIAALVLAMIFRLVVVHQAITAVQILAALVTAVVLDVPLTYIRRKVLVSPASALITGGIVALVLFTSATWPFVLASALAILSKHVIRTAERHVFNPATFGLAAVLLAFPHLVQAGTDKWEVSAALSPVLILGGGLAAREAKTFFVVDRFMPAYIGLLLLFSLAPHGGALFHSPGPILSSFKQTLFAAHHDFAIFAFYLLADPRTAPLTKPGRRDYAILAGLLGMLLTLPGLGRMTALLVSLLICNLVAVLVLNKRYAKEEVVTMETTVAQRPPMPLLIANTILGLVGRSKKAPVTEAAVGEPGVEEPSPTARPAEPGPAPALGAGMGGIPASADGTVVLPSLNRFAGGYLSLLGDSSTRYPLAPRDVSTVGRAPDNVVCLSAPGVSRYHAILSSSGEKTLLTDLKSSNGTFVNGNRVHGTVEVHDSDLIDFGGEMGTALYLRLPAGAGVESRQVQATPAP